MVHVRIGLANVAGLAALLGAVALFSDPRAAAAAEEGPVSTTRPAAEAATGGPSAATGDRDLRLTARRLHARSKAEVTAMRRLIQRHQKLLSDARESELVVAIDAIRKDLQSARDLLSFAQSRLGELRRDLALDEQPERVVADPLEYPQVRELQVLRDQIERLYLSGKRFLANLRRPTETRIERQDAGTD